MGVFTIQELRILWVELIHKESSAAEAVKSLGGSVAGDLLVFQASPLRSPAHISLHESGLGLCPVSFPHSDSPIDCFIHVLSSYSARRQCEREGSMPFPHRGTYRLGGEDLGFPGGSELRIHLQYRRCRRLGFDPWVGKIPWRSSWQPTPVFLPEESHRQRSLEGYSPCGRKELDTTERLSTRSSNSCKLS